MKIDIDKEWCINMAKQEGDVEIGVSHYDSFIMDNVPYATISEKVVPLKSCKLSAHSLRRELIKMMPVQEESETLIWLVKENKPQGRVFESSIVDLNECNDFILVGITRKDWRDTWTYPENFVG